MKIISGGQTGADRAALDAAINLGMEYGGALPLGRIAEDGSLPKTYSSMTELPTTSYPARTAKNVRDADATLVFSMGQPDKGTALTIDLAKKYARPFLAVDLKEESEEKAVLKISKWIKNMNPEILNVAGSRESKSPGIYRLVYNIMLKVLS